MAEIHWILANARTCIIMEVPLLQTVCCCMIGTTITTKVVCVYCSRDKGRDFLSAAVRCVAEPCLLFCVDTMPRTARGREEKRRLRIWETATVGLVCVTRALTRARVSYATSFFGHWRRRTHDMQIPISDNI